MLQSGVDQRNAMCLLQVACLYDDHALREQCLSAIGPSAATLLDSDEVLAQPRPIIAAILRSSKLCIGEVRVVCAVVSWVVER